MGGCLFQAASPGCHQGWHFLTEEKIKLAPKQTASRALMPNDVASLSCLSLWLQAASQPSLHGRLSWTLPVCSPGSRLGTWAFSLSPLVACCSTSTHYMPWRGAGLEECTGGALGEGRCHFLVWHWLHLCSRGCLLTRQRHFLLCILYFNKRFLKRGTATPPLWWVREGFPGNRTPTPKWKRWRVCQVKDNRKSQSPREWCSRG